MPRVLSTAFCVALLAATAGAFALTEGAKTELSPIFGTQISTKVFSPGCDPRICDAPVATLRFKLRKRERIAVWMERGGERAVTLVPGRTYPKGPVTLQFAGVDDTGLTLPDGAYVPVIRFTREHRTLTLPSRIVIDTKAPRVVRVRHHVYTHISPDNDGRNDVFRVPYTLSEPAHAVLLVDGRQVELTRFLRMRGVLSWNGKIDGRVVRTGQSRARDRCAGRRRQPLGAVPVRGRPGPVRRARPDADPRPAGPALRRPGAHRFAQGRLALQPEPRRGPLAHASPACPGEARGLPSLRHRGRPCRAGAGGGRVTAELARAGGVVGALGLALLILSTSRLWRLVGLIVWAAGCGALVLWLAPSGHHRVLAAAALLGVAVAVAARVAVRPGPVAAPGRRARVRAGADSRSPSARRRRTCSCRSTASSPRPCSRSRGSSCAATAARASSARSRGRWRSSSRWTGIAFSWTGGRLAERDGAIYLLFFVLPFGLLAVVIARLPWRIGWVKVLYVQLALMALGIGLIGIWQYATRNVFWNPKVIVDNAYAPLGWYYRVNSVFYDPSIYGRFLVVGIIASLVVVLFAKGGVAWAALAAAAVTWLGLAPSFSQSSFVALGGRDRRRPHRALAAAGGRAARGRRLPHCSSSRSACPRRATASSARPACPMRRGGRSKLVSHGVRLALDHPVVGVGTGGFVQAYAKATHLKGKHPKAAASHTTPITVAVETGLPGFALFCWLIVVVLVVPFRRNPVTTATGRARLAFGLALIAISVHSLFYNALFEDPLFWALIGLSAVAAREPAA